MKKYYRILVFLFLITSTNKSVQAQINRTLETKVADILAQYPTNDNQQANTLSQEIIDLGFEGIEQLTSMLLPLGEGDDTQIRYALASLAKYVSRAEGSSAKTIVETSILDAIEQSEHTEVKVFLIRRLYFCATDNSIEQLEKYLTQRELGFPAISVFIGIGSEKAKQTLLNHIHDVTNQQDIIKALGVLKYNKALPVIEGLAVSDDNAVQKEALHALSKIASPKSKDIIVNAAEKAKFSASSNEATVAYIEFTRNLGRNGNKSLSKDLSYKLIENTTLENQWHLRSAGFSILAENFRNQLTKALLKEAKKTQNKKYLKSIITIANRKMPSDEVKSWLKIYRKLSNDCKIILLSILAKRQEKIILTSGILPALQSNNEVLRIEAIKSLAINQKEEAVPILLGVLKKERSKEELQTVYEALQRTVSKERTDLFIESFTEFPKASQKIVLKLIKDKKAKQHFEFVYVLAMGVEEDLKIEACNTISDLTTSKNMHLLVDLLSATDNDIAILNIQKGLSNIISHSTEDEKSDIVKRYQKGNFKAKLLPVFPAINTKEALEVIEVELNTANKIAATDALLLWKGKDALPLMLNIVEKNLDTSKAIFTAYISTVITSEIPEEQKLLLIKKVLPFAKTDNQKIEILSAVGKVKTFLSLVFVSEYVNDETFSQIALKSVIDLILPLPGERIRFKGNFVKEMAQKAIDDYKGRGFVFKKVDLIALLDKLPDDKGFVSIFNGKDLTGWEGLVQNPIARKKMSSAALLRAKKEANQKMQEDWFVQDGVIKFRGTGYNNIVSAKNYEDFELLVDWKISSGGDSGIYLRGTPQVQIWDIANTDVGAQVGSGALYNNQKNKNVPLTVADNPINEWNTFHIKMIGERVTVYLNGVLVTDNVLLENYWDKTLPIFEKGAIELQAHGENLGFRNVYIREISAGNNLLTEEEKESGFKSLFDGKNLDYWVGNKEAFYAENNELLVRPKQGGQGNLFTAEEYSDFNFRFEFQLTPGANNGLGIHAPLTGDAAYLGKELQILDNTAKVYSNLKEYQYHGSVYGVIPAKRGFLKPVGQWNSQEVIVKGNDVKVILNGEVILEGNWKEASKQGTLDKKDHPGLKKNKGHIGFLGHRTELQFRNIRIKELIR